MNFKDMIKITKKASQSPAKPVSQPSGTKKSSISQKQMIGMGLIFAGVILIGIAIMTW